MIRLLSVFLVLLTLDTGVAESVVTGFWLTADHDGIIKVFSCGDSLCAEIAGVILDHATDPTPVDHRGVSQCHLELITDAREVRPDLWKGHIIDPRNGNIYGVELHLDPRGNLALRGFLGIPLLGHTQTWTRYAGPVPDDCRMQAGGDVTVQSLGQFGEVPSVPNHAR